MFIIYQLWKAFPRIVLQRSTVHAWHVSNMSFVMEVFWRKQLNCNKVFTSVFQSLFKQPGWPPGLDECAGW